jgi:hypothetical protein
VEFNEAIALNVDVQTFDMDGIAKAGVGAFQKGGAMRFEAYVGTSINKAESGGSGRKGDVVCGGEATLRSGVINRRAIPGGGRIGVMRMKICVQHATDLKLFIGRGEGVRGRPGVRPVLGVDEDRLQDTDDAKHLRVDWWRCSFMSGGCCTPGRRATKLP